MCNNDRIALCIMFVIMIIEGGVYIINSNPVNAAAAAVMLLLIVLTRISIAQDAIMKQIAEVNRKATNAANK